MTWAEKNAATRTQLRNWNRTRPETARGFGALQKGVKDEGVLDFRVKELVALGIAISTRCDACIGLHAEALVREGASRDEVADVLSVAVQMGGGPALMYAAKALEAFDEFAAGKPAG